MNNNDTLPVNIQHAKNLATVVYALQSAGFAIGITYFIAPVIIYMKRETAAGTWVESHLRWQLNTFWYSVAWAIVGGLTLTWGIGLMILTAVTLWIIFRIVQGWSALSRNQPIPAAAKKTVATP